VSFYCIDSEGVHFHLKFQQLDEITLRLKELKHNLEADRALASHTNVQKTLSPMPSHLVHSK